MARVSTGQGHQTELVLSPAIYSRLRFSFRHQGLSLAGEDAGWKPTSRTLLIQTRTVLQGGKGKACAGRAKAIIGVEGLGKIIYSSHGCNWTIKA